MQILLIFLWLTSVGVRLAVVAAPFIYIFMFMEQPSFGVLAGIPGYVLAPVYSFFAFFLLFWRDIAAGAANHQSWLAQLSDEERAAYFRRMKEEAEETSRRNEDNTFDRWTPGTVTNYNHQFDDSKH